MFLPARLDAAAKERCRLIIEGDWKDAMTPGWEWEGVEAITGRGSEAALKQRWNSNGKKRPVHA